MSGLPSRRHNRTSHFHDIFRGSSTNASHQESQPGSSARTPFPIGASDGQFEGERTVELPVKKRSTRIPLFGRSRKKSTHSELPDSTPARLSDAQSGRGSTATYGSRLHPDDQSRASTSQVSLANTSQPTLGSKIVAHLTPRKSRKHKRTPPSPNDGLSDYTSDALSLPSSKSLRHSVDSCSSREGRPSSHGLRQSGSITPRPTHTPQLAQPTITISQADSYDLGEYDDLFTKPRQKAKSKPAPLQIPALAEKHRDQTRDSSASTESSTSSANPPPDFGFSEAGTQSSAASTPTPETPTPTMDSSCSASAQVSSPSEVAVDPRKSRDDQLTADEISFNARSKPTPPSRKEASLKSLQAATDTELYSGAEESDAMSIMSLPLLGSSPMSRRRRKVSVQTNSKTIIPLSYRPLPPAPPSKPPTIPLPATPNVGRPRASTLSNSTPNNSQTTLKRHNSASSHALLSSSPSSLASTPREAPSADADSVRTAKSPDHSSQSSSSSSASSSTLTLTKTQYPQIQPLDIELDTASADELRLALRKRNMQLENLANYIQKVSELHAQEKAQLEKHIADLERDIERRDKEIKGLNWMVRNGAEGSENVSGTPRSLATPDLEREKSDDSSIHSARIATPSSSVRLPVYRHLHPEDSGAESYATSGAESARYSGTSGPESGDLFSKPKRAVRKLKLVESFNKNNSLSRPFAPKQPDGNVVPYFSRTRHTSTPSIYSTSSSGSSPFSSPTSVTFSAAAAGLTSIPEARPATANSPSTNSKDQTTRDRDRKERERKLSNTSSSRGSSPSPAPPKQSKSTTPSRLTPSEAYANNLKKDRPQSIAQVLNAGNKSEPTTAPIMEESFGGRSRALLGLVPSKKPAGSSPTRW